MIPPPARPMLHTLIIGYGNPLRGDDGIGPRAAEWLLRSSLPTGAAVLICQQLTIELAAQIAEVDRLILIDAAARDEPGVVYKRVLAPAIPESSSLTHYLDAPGLLAAAQILYGRAPKTTLFTVGGGSFDPGETLSPAVAAALPGLLAQIHQAVR